MNIEVFKTDVADAQRAEMILDRIHSLFGSYKANFDLQDRDRILRIVSANGPVKANRLVGLLQEMGHRIEVLPDQ